MYAITYEYESANGRPVVKRIVNLSKVQAIAICENITSIDGYKLKDISVQKKRKEFGGKS